MGTQEEDSRPAENVVAQAGVDASGTVEPAPPADVSADTASPATEPPQSVVSPSSPVRVQATAVTPSHAATIPASENAPVGGAQATDIPHSSEDPPEPTQPADGAGDMSIVTDDSNGTQAETQTQPDTTYEGSTLASFSGAPSATPSTYGELNQLPLPAKDETGARTPSANRVSISYASGTKRLVIDAEVVDRLKLLRAEGRVEIALKLERMDALELRGILVSPRPAQRLFGTY